MNIFTKILSFSIIFVLVVTLHQPTAHADHSVNQSDKNSLISEIKSLLSDIKETSFAYKEIDYFLSAGIISGYKNRDTGEMSFKPKLYVTRAQFTKILVSALGVNVMKHPQQYSDVSDGRWYTNYINTASINGIISGYGDGTFRPNEKITRGQMAAMIVRAFNDKLNKNSVSVKSFPDVSRYSSFYSEISQASSLKIISGYGDGTFKPNRHATRDQAVVMIYRAVVNVNPLTEFEKKIDDYNNGSINKVRMGPKLPGYPGVKLGATKQEVVFANGSPAYVPDFYFNDDNHYWIYRDGSVVFFDRDGRMSSYINEGMLHVEIAPKDPMNPPIKYDSSQKDVVASMGTPDSVNAYFFNYGEETTYTVNVSVEYGALENVYRGYYYTPYIYFHYGQSYVAFNRDGELSFRNEGELHLDFGEIDPTHPGIKMGATREEVVKAMGTPDSINGNVWSYGESSIMIENDQVINYTNAGNLKVQTGQINPDAPNISIASTYEDVLAAMGNPTEGNIAEDYGYFKYGNSIIRFRYGVVYEIENTDKNIKISNYNEANAGSTFTFGSTPDEVVQAMGIPIEVSGLLYMNWKYENGFQVGFDKQNKVNWWSTYGNNIKVNVHAEPAHDPNAPPVTLGSSKDDVMRALGAPISIGGNKWYYIADAFTNSVTFNDEWKVIGWYNPSGELKTHLADPIANTDKLSVIRSKEQDVLNVFGTPDVISDDDYNGYISYMFGDYKLYVDKDTKQIVGWQDYGSDLSFEKNYLETVAINPNAKLIDIGDNMMDVLVAIGYPDKAIPVYYNSQYRSDEIRLWYGRSSIYFNESKEVKRISNNGDLSGKVVE